MLNTIKSLLGISGTGQDAILSFYLDLAEKAVLRYTNLDALTTTLQNPTIKLAMYYYNNRNETNVSSVSQGARSVSYKNSTDKMPDDIIAMLPYPKIRVLGEDD
jgi:hypothetical protein